MNGEIENSLLNILVPFFCFEISFLTKTVKMRECHDIIAVTIFILNQSKYLTKSKGRKFKVLRISSCFYPAFFHQLFLNFLHPKMILQPNLWVYIAIKYSFLRGNYLSKQEKRTQFATYLLNKNTASIYHLKRFEDQKQFMSSNTVKLSAK